MAQSTRPRRNGSGRSERAKRLESKKRSAQQAKQPSRASKKRKKDSTTNNKAAPKKTDDASADQEAMQHQQQADDEELFKVEKIVDFKLDKNGVPLYKTRWKGYSASDDTWEPGQNVASTGHLDRWERQQRRKKLRTNHPGVAVIEYEDGERETVSLIIEKFRAYHPDSDDEAERDDDTVDGDDDVNNFSIVREGEWIEMLWPHTHIYFPCKVVSWVPPKRTQKKSSKLSTEESSSVATSSVQSHQKERKVSSKRSNRRVIDEDVEESSVSNSVQSQQNNDSKGASKTSKSQDDLQTGDTSIAQANKMEIELAQQESAPQGLSLREDGKSINTMQVHEKDQHDSDEDSYESGSSGFSRSVEKVGHGVPLFDEPEDDFDSPDTDDSDSDCEENLEGRGFNSQRGPIQSGVPKLSFEEQWMLKLRRTQEMIDRGS